MNIGMEELFLTTENIQLLDMIGQTGSIQNACACMLVSGWGLLAGTVGGGAVEHRCITAARERLGTAHPEQYSFDLTPEDKAGLGMVCGGAVRDHILPISAGNPAALALCREAAEHFAHGTPFWLALPLQGGRWPSGQNKKGFPPARKSGQWTAGSGLWSSSSTLGRCISLAAAMWPRRWSPY